MSLGNIYDPSILVSFALRNDSRRNISGSGTPYWSWRITILITITKCKTLTWWRNGNYAYLWHPPQYRVLQIIIRENFVKEVTMAPAWRLQLGQHAVRIPLLLAGRNPARLEGLFNTTTNGHTRWPAHSSIPPIQLPSRTKLQNRWDRQEGSVT